MSTTKPEATETAVATSDEITLVQIDPAKAVVGLNVRSDAALTPEFVASIRELGVLIALCRLLASLEKGTARQSWRRVAPATADYLAFIAANGYDLSDVEKRAAGLSKPKPARQARATTVVSTSAPTAADGAGTAGMHDQDVTATEADDEDAQARSADDTSAA